MIERYEGFLDRSTNISRYTRLRATSRLWDYIDTLGFEVHRETGNEESYLSITGRNSPYLIEYSDSFECIRLKNEFKTLIPYDDTPTTHELRRFLSEWNHFASCNWIDLLLTDEQMRLVHLELAQGNAENTEDEDDSKHIEFSKNRLYRVFNNSSFEQGGRFYGGWWQLVPSEYRRYITINGAPTRELDFSNLQAAMLYALVGVPLQGYAYEIDGIDRSYRKLIKSTFFKLINAKEGQRVEPPRVDALPPGYTWRMLRDALAERHAPIARYFNSGIGIELQRKDADIAQAVMTEFLQRRILVLPIHDSFITYRAEHQNLEESMRRCYRVHVGAPIEVDPDRSFANWILGPEEEIGPGHELDQFVIERWHELRDAPEYAAYNARKADFLRDKDEEWMWEFGPL